MVIPEAMDMAQEEVIIEEVICMVAFQEVTMITEGMEAEEAIDTMEITDMEIQLEVEITDMEI